MQNLILIIGMSKGKENSVKTLVSRGAGITKGEVGWLIMFLSHPLSFLSNQQGDADMNDNSS